jgi:hypothetical protein
LVDSPHATYLDMRLDWNESTCGSGDRMTLASVAILVSFDCDGVHVDSEIVAARVLAGESFRDRISADGSVYLGRQFPGNPHASS